MNIESILSYQETDIELRKLEEEVERSEDYKNAIKARSAYNEAKKKSETAEKEAEKITKYFQHYKNATEELLKQAAELEALANEEQDEHGLDVLSEQLDKLYAKLTAAEGDINKISKHAEDVVKVSANAKTVGAKMREEYNTNRIKFEELKNSVEPKMQEIREKLNAIENSAGFDRKLLEKYTALRRDKKLPAFVPLTEDSRCRGCMMELPMNKLTVLKSETITECESCNRIIYYKQ